MMSTTCSAASHAGRGRPLAFRGAGSAGVQRALVACGCALALGVAQAGVPAGTIAAVKASVVGVGSFQKTRSPAINFTGTGFVVGDGLSVISNAHVVPELLDSEKMETLGVVVGRGNQLEFRTAVLVERDREHDLAHLRISGAPLRALELGDSLALVEGRELAFTGFPLGMVLGLHPVTHRAMLSAITPVVMPSLSSRKLDVRMISQLQKSPFIVFQLDGTAYPGNSGSPVYDPETGAVYGVISMVMVKGLKENAIARPSGITYAVPANFVRDLLQRKSP